MLTASPERLYRAPCADNAQPLMVLADQCFASRLRACCSLLLPMTPSVEDAHHALERPDASEFASAQATDAPDDLRAVLPVAEQRTQVSTATHAGPPAASSAVAASTSALLSAPSLEQPSLALAIDAICTRLERVASKWGVPKSESVATAPAAGSEVERFKYVEQVCERLEVFAAR